LPNPAAPQRIERANFLKKIESKGEAAHVPVTGAALRRNCPTAQVGGNDVAGATSYGDPATHIAGSLLVALDAWCWVLEDGAGRQCSKTVLEDGAGRVGARKEKRLGREQNITTFRQFQQHFLSAVH
jgi:hypothetical protein